MAYAYWKLAGKDVGFLNSQMSQAERDVALTYESMLKRRIGPAVDSWGRKRDSGGY
jgi:hypothetical protein